MYVIRRMNKRRLLNFPVVPHHVVEEDVLVDDGTVTHVIVDELALGDAFTLPVTVQRVTVRSAISEVVNERLQHLTLRPVAVYELGMLYVIVRRLHIRRSYSFESHSQ